MRDGSREASRAVVSSAVAFAGDTDACHALNRSAVVVVDDDAGVAGAGVASFFAYTGSHTTASAW